MAKPTRKAIVAGLEAWDAPVNDNFSVLFDAATPIPEYGSIASLPAANQFDRCLAAVNNTTDTPATGWVLMFSDGSTWRKIGVQAANVANGSGATLAQLETRVNNILTAMKNAGVMAGP